MHLWVGIFKFANSRRVRGPDDTIYSRTVFQAVRGSLKDCPTIALLQLFIKVVLHKKVGSRQEREPDLDLNHRQSRSG